MSWENNYQEWQQFNHLASNLKEELALISNDEKKLEDAFYAPLEFGTAGMRGFIGVGINRMNIYTVRQATEGLALLMSSKGEAEKKRGVAIAYDSRHFSPEFAMEAGKVLAKHDIPSFIFESLRPTPELSFAVRELNALAGIMITASHNPAPYNGYKVYGEDGAQMPPHDADALTEFIRGIESPLTIEVADETEAKASGLIQIIGEVIDNKYLELIKDVTINSELIKTVGKDLKLVFTPLHGTGEMLGRKALAQAGFEQIKVVEAQAIPDGDFPTVKSPNPEAKSAFNLAIELGKKEDADVLIATDPDADRLGVAVRTEDGDYTVLSGNQIGAILTKYILEAHKQAGTLPDNATIIKSIVSSELPTVIANSYGVETQNVLTGFKFIAEKIEQFEETGSNTYMFGFEESYGYLIKPFVRDKDAIQAALLTAEVVAFYKSQGKTLYDGLQDIFKEYGYFAERTISVTLSGIDGSAKIKNIMDKFRKSAPEKLNNTNVVITEDFLELTKIVDGQVEKLTTPPSNVLKYQLADGSWVAVRPSGTEPKIKFYLATQSDSFETAEAKLDVLEHEINEIVGE
ncbi:MULTISPECIES: phospho-sugar mutase [unclassified Enterococcus]|uniref:phospho-sugar mutase n=1 Tax=unclassified Enterococcus TaxID=2608891 RepID=UPI00155206CA|nr:MULTISPECIES: phospho-sugar mutase [unclassified Enterococcus]MBS7578066.1 phospho-sugar mutase [Enterococcus sp. MMGLQ5-2]MBS7585326.1 phospho-sugar mutase [Enterococcus sp. MMGLQ5-1]NPD13183.1 phospho-sugar mutase [Enterococcus sp. MMGLQ5-1]NPD37897.1 phospho-sugar mutase [Enterococcus sp. MMGLQ5-2]